jgi:putative nucleotidyltransferase with HDIG domain
MITWQGKPATLNFLSDIEERMKAENALKKVNSSLKIISESNSCLVRATNEKDFLNDVCRIIRENGNYYMVWIGLIEAVEKDILRPVAYAGSEFFDYASEKIDLKDAKGRYKILRAVISSGKFQICNKLPDDRQPCFGPVAAAGQPCRSILSLPLFFDNRTMGALTIYSACADAFDDQETKLLMDLVNDISYGITTLRMRIHNLQVEEQVKMSLIRAETALESTVKALGVTSELRDPYTAGHQRRVTQLANAIAREMGFTENRIDGIRVAGLLHDIGKIMIPAEILTKPSKLTEVEFAIVKTHSMASYDILKSIEFPWPVAQIVIQHHEKLDGSGYPSGLKGDAILLEAKILCVADIVEAMSSHRPYRPALGIDVALEDMLANKGVLYDPVVVDTCVKLFREKGFKFE